MNKILTKAEFLKMLSSCEIKEFKPKESKVKFSSLTAGMFKDNPYILDRYFKNEFGYRCCFANLLGIKEELDQVKKDFSKKYPNKEFNSIKEIHKILERDFNLDINLTGYKYDKEHYRFYSAFNQLDYEENELWQEKAREEELNRVEYNRIEPLDLSNAEKLYKVVIKAIKQRLIMLLNLDGCIGLLNNAYDCFNKGVTCSSVNIAISAKLAELRKTLENKEVQDWLKTGVSDMTLFTDEVNLNSYIRTYQTILRQLTDIRDENLEYAKDIIHNDLDIYENSILENKEVIETINLEIEDNDDMLD